MEFHGSCGGVLTQTVERASSVLVEPAVLRLRTSPDSAHLARQMVGETSTASGRPELIDDACLVVSELVARSRCSPCRALGSPEVCRARSKRRGGQRGRVRVVLAMIVGGVPPVTGADRRDGEVFRAGFEVVAKLGVRNRHSEPCLHPLRAKR
jgi:hypothetical protein